MGIDWTKLRKSPELSNDLLLRLADDAFVVLNWARRAGMKKELQLQEVVEAFKVTLSKADK